MASNELDSKALERFKTKIMVASDGCHLWMGYRHLKGYGGTHVGGKAVYAHRLAWQIANGPIPEGMVIDHICRVRCCVNPRHLRLVTNRQNVTENSLSVVAENTRKTRCPKCNGEYRRRGDGTRRCLACHNATSNRQRTIQRAANREKRNAIG